jgi:hypothetical protein
MKKEIETIEPMAVQHSLCYLVKLCVSDGEQMLLAQFGWAFNQAVKLVVGAKDVQRQLELFNRFAYDASGVFLAAK